MKILILFSVGRKIKTECRMLVGGPIEVRDFDALGADRWVRASRGLPSVEDVLAAGLARFAETTDQVLARTARGAAGFPLYPKGVVSVGDRLEVSVGDMTGKRECNVAPLSGFEDA